MKHQQYPIRPSKIREGTQDAVLIREGKIGDALAGLRPSSVVIVRCVHVLGIQFSGDWFSGGSPTTKLSHDCSFFRQIIRHFVGHRYMSSQSIINAPVDGPARPVE
jgi:hypothetical protein